MLLKLLVWNYYFYKSQKPVLLYIFEKLKLQVYLVYFKVDKVSFSNQL